MNWRQDILIRAGFGLALLILVALGIQSYRSTERLIGHEDGEVRADRVMEGLDQVLAELLTCESAERDYVQTGEARLLRPYPETVERVGQSIQRLEALTAGDPNQVQIVNSIKVSAAERLAFHRHMIDLGRSQGRQAASNLFLTGEGSRLITRIRGIVGEMKATSGRIWRERSEAAGADARASLWALQVGYGLSLTILILVYYTLNRQVAMRRHSEQRLVRSNRLYSVLIRVSEAIVRSPQRSTLFREVCRITVEQGLFRMAWVGLVDTTTLLVTPAAHYGADDGYLDRVSISVSPAAEGRGPTGTAFREEKPSVCQDIRSDSRMEPWREEALKRGFASSAAFPIVLRRGPIGTFTAYAGEKDFFDQETVALLQGVTADLAFAVDSIEQEEERRRAEQEVVRLNEYLERRIEARTAELIASNRELEQRGLELEKASRLKTEFMARMSHELRTPMNAIIGFSDLLAEQAEGPLHETYARFVTHIREGARHLLALINDVLDLSKIEAGRIELSREEFPAAQTLSEVLSVIRPLALVKRLEMESRVEPDLRIFADRRRFKQILYNLLSNALKFTPEGGRVWVESSRRSGWLLFTVGDTGLGIAPADQAAVFLEFHQVGVTTKGVKEGTGLGLAITKRLVELHGGTIALESEPGRGSLFTFSIPAEGAAEGAE